MLTHRIPSRIDKAIILSYDQPCGALCMKEPSYTFHSFDKEKMLNALGKDDAIKAFSNMLLIRHFEIRGEQAYSQGRVGGFYHSYIGQEAIQAACIAASGTDHWFTATYRCHALALLLGATPDELMAELYGKATGNAGGRGGSMHFYTDRMLGGLAIVGGHVPIAAGAAFSLQYQEDRTKASFCFLGDGAVAQGAFHESMNLASIWDLPLITVIENNQWGMGTAIHRAVCIQPIAEHFAKAYNMTSYTLNGMDFLQCYSGFQAALEESVTNQRPVLIEVVTHRFRGHSVSDPAHYRSKEELDQIMKEDPLPYFQAILEEKGWLTKGEYEAMDEAAKKQVLAAMKKAEEAPFPDPITLEEGVFAPEDLL